MTECTCPWIFLPALDDVPDRVCGAPVDGDSGYYAAHQEEMIFFIASNTEGDNLGTESCLPTILEPQHHPKR